MSKIKFNVTFLGDRNKQLKSFSTITKAVEWVKKNAANISQINGMYLSRSDKKSDLEIARLIRAYNILSDFDRIDAEYLEKPKDSKHRAEIIMLRNLR